MDLRVILSFTEVSLKVLQQGKVWLERLAQHEMQPAKQKTQPARCRKWLTQHEKIPTSNE